jgi:hypothetical protein
MHYYVWVLCSSPVPEHDADIDCLLGPLLAPFNMEKSGPERVTQCNCSTEEGRSMARLMESIFGNGPSSPIDEPLGTHWSECPDCHGTGNYVLRSNPVGWWDCWERGGRWTGRLDRCLAPVSKACDAAGFLPGTGECGAYLQAGQIALRDVAPAESVRDKMLSGDISVPYAIIHPVSGAWIWSCTGKPVEDEVDDDRRSDWREILSTALQQAQFVIVVDIHS